jgi:hypothetical protein
MRFWSKGLGKRCLSMDCGTESVSVDGNAMMILSGTVRPPLGWAYTITMDHDDWLDFIELTCHPAMVRYLLRRRRLGLAMRAGGHLALFYLAYARRLLAVKVGRLIHAHPGQSPAQP